MGGGMSGGPPAIPEAAAAGGGPPDKAEAAAAGGGGVACGCAAVPGGGSRGLDAGGCTPPACPGCWPGGFAAPDNSGLGGWENSCEVQGGVCVMYAHWVIDALNCKSHVQQW